jgi:hypothetical protein
VNTINFNSRDWSSIRDTIRKINASGTMQFGHTEDGKSITFDVQDAHTLVTEVLQHNGWVRKNIYHADDYTVEELYKRA